MRMNNRWNRFIYRAWAPIYDALLERLFGWGRRRAMEVAAPTGGDRLCFVGIGTGTDLLLLHSGVEAVGIDLSEAMLARAREKLPIPGCGVTLLAGDAEALPFDDTDGPFDIVMLNLILTAVRELVDTAPDAEVVERVVGIVIGVDGVRDAHDVRIRTVGGLYHVQVHVVVAGDLTVREGHRIADDVTAGLERCDEPIGDVTVHVDPED